MISGPIN